MSSERKTPSERRTEAFANQLIEAIKNNTAPWLRPWDEGELYNHRPHNVVTGGYYNGINRMILSTAAIEKGYKTGEWCTRLQAEKHNMRLKKDEKPTYICFFIRPKEEEEVVNLPEEQAERAMRGGMVTFAVYNLEQFENRNRTIFEILDKPPQQHEIHERAEGILKESGADIRHSYANEAYYAPKDDYIHLPHQHTFLSSGGYYATALHELAHWTGHPDRLDRLDNAKFGSQSYAREELRAEIASYMLSEEIGVAFDPTNHVSYIQSWVKNLEDHPKEILNACRDAERIFQYIEQFDRHKSKDKNADLKAHLEDSREFVKNYDLRMQMPTEERAELVIEIAENTEAVSDYKSVARALRDETGFSQFTMRALRNVAEARNYDEKMRLAMIITPTDEQLGRRLMKNSSIDDERAKVDDTVKDPISAKYEEVQKQLSTLTATITNPIIEQVVDRNKLKSAIANYAVSVAKEYGALTEQIKESQPNKLPVQVLPQDKYFSDLAEQFQTAGIPFKAEDFRKMASYSNDYQAVFYAHTITPSVADIQSNIETIDKKKDEVKQRE